MEPLTEPEHVVLLRETLRRFVADEMPRRLARQWDQRDEFPREVFARLASLGVMGLTVPEAYGGVGPDVVATMATIEELASRSMAICSPYIQSACYAGMNLAELGSEEQKRDLLPRVAAGEMMFAYGISEPDVGADVASVKTTARREGDAVVVNGAKRFCSGAAFSDYIYTLVRSGEADARYQNLTLLLVPPDAAGVTVEPQRALGLKGSATADVTFRDVRLPASSIMGGEKGWNAGWGMLVGPGLDVEKIEVAAMALGIARAAVEDAWEYSQQREQFGKPICTLQSIRHMLAEVKTRLEACRLVTYDAAARIDQGQEVGVATSMAKLFVSDSAVEIVLTCQRVLGAYGYVGDGDMERYVRDVLAMPIIGGSSAVQKNNICNRLKLPR
ncbi:MAG: acyl-CoA dehydrogenase family protein [Myxococcales bacterium]|nr:acyl-CoA dehydrogenase family protein [Myxococcales bacterium]